MDLFSTKIAYASLDTFLVKVSVEILNPLIIFLFTVAMVIFLYGVAEFILNPDNEEVRTNAKSHMIWGVVGITIMMAAWPLMALMVDTFDLRGIDIDNQGHFDVQLGP